MSEIVLEPKEQVKPSYDATKPYRWEPDTKFTFDGASFGFLFNWILKEEKEWQIKGAAIELMKSKLKEAVENGYAVEAPSGTPPPVI